MLATPERKHCRLSRYGFTWSPRSNLLSSFQKRFSTKRFHGLHKLVKIRKRKDEFQIQKRDKEKSNMAEQAEPDCQLRRRRTSANSGLPLHLEVGFQIDEGNPNEGTPGSPSKAYPGTSKRNSAAFLDFKNKQQSFDIQIEECEEEEIILDSDDEEPEESVASGINRAVTPTPIQDFGANVTHSEGPPSRDFLRVKTIDNDCYTDVSDDETDNEEQL